MIKYRVDNLAEYERTLRIEVIADIENAQKFLTQMGSHTDWSAPEQAIIRSDVNACVRRLNRNAAMANDICAGVGNTRAALEQRLRARSDSFNAFPQSVASGSPVRRRGLLSIIRPIIFQPTSPFLSGIINNRRGGIFRRG